MLVFIQLLWFQNSINDGFFTTKKKLWVWLKRHGDLCGLTWVESLTLSGIKCAELQRLSAFSKKRYSIGWSYNWHAWSYVGKQLKLLIYYGCQIDYSRWQWWEMGLTIEEMIYGLHKPGRYIVQAQLWAQLLASEFFG